MTKFVGVSKTARRITLKRSECDAEAIVEVREVLRQRTRVAFTLAKDGAAFGSGPLVVQLYDDEAPVGAEAFRSMALAVGARLSSLQPGVRADFRAATRALIAREEVTSSRNSPGLVTLSGSGFSISLHAPPRGDQLVGVVTSGLDIVTALCSLPCGEDGTPIATVLLCAGCTLVSGAGDGAELALALSHAERAAQAASSEAQRGESAAETRRRLDAESTENRQNTAAAVAVAMQKKRKRSTPPSARGGMLAQLMPDEDSDSDPD